MDAWWCLAGLARNVGFQDLLDGEVREEQAVTRIAFRYQGFGRRDVLLAAETPIVDLLFDFHQTLDHLGFLLG